MKFVVVLILQLTAFTFVSATANLPISTPSNDNCQRTKKKGNIDFSLHFQGRKYDPELDRTTFQYSFSRLLEDTENVVFGINNCFPGDKVNYHKFFNDTCFYGHMATQVESFNLYELHVKGDVDETVVVVHKFNDEIYSLMSTFGPNCWCRDQGFLCQEDHAKMTTKYICYNYPESENDTCGNFKDFDNKGQVYYPNIGCQVSVKLPTVLRKHRCAYASSASRLGVEEKNPGVIFYTCDTNFCNPKASSSTPLFQPTKVFLLTLLSNVVCFIFMN